jgi:hypothetical protein
VESGEVIARALWGIFGIVLGWGLWGITRKLGGK